MPLTRRTKRRTLARGPDGAGQAFVEASKSVLRPRHALPILPRVASPRAPILFAKESLRSSLWDEALPLLFAHWQEIAHYQDIPLNPDRLKYAQLEAGGFLRTFTARTDGVLVGYACFTLMPSLHYAQSMQAACDVVYLEPWVRGLTGAKFLKFCTLMLFMDGADVVYHHVKHAHDFGPVLARQGFEPIETLWGKRSLRDVEPGAFDTASREPEMAVVD